MTFVAEPYLHVVDQVLTALTGGVARESHRFFPGANAFSFEVGGDRVIPESVRVFGQAAGAFVAFEPNRDFAIGRDGILRFLASGDDPSQPAKGATWPDTGTEIHVGYYDLDSGGAPLTDRNVGSLVRTLAEAFARELTVLRAQLEAVYRSAFVETAEGPSLDMVVALLGLTRKGRDFAAGTVRFVRDTPAPADIFVPAGAKISTAIAAPAGPAGGGGSAKSKPVSFVTTADRTLRRGQLAVEAPIRSEEQGARGVVDAKTITVIDQTIFGISGVVNDAPTVFGGSGETDDELRRRARTLAERAGRATPRALVNALTELSVIRDNDVKVVEELQLRPGVVQVFVAADPTPELAVAVDDAIRETRAAGVRVEHNLQAFLPGTTEPATSNGDLREDGTTEGEAAGADFRYPLCANVVVFPEDPRIAGADRDALAQGIRNVVAADVEASQIGGTIVYNRVAADVMAVPGVLDMVLDLAPAPGSPDQACVGKRNLEVPAGQRAVIDAERAIAVTFAGAPVSFDVQARVVLKAGATVGAALAEIRQRLGPYFAGGPSTVDTTGLLAAVGASDLFTLAAEDVSWTAEHEQAGLIVREPGGPGAATALPEGDRAVLRDVTVEEKTS